MTQQNAIYTLDGADDRCGGAQAATAVGIAFLNPNGTVGFGITTVLRPLPVAESFSFSGVPAGTYTLAVRGINDVGSSAPSNIVTLTFPGTCTAPASPTNFVVAKTGRTVFASWALPPAGAAPRGFARIVGEAYVGNIPLTAREVAGTVTFKSYDLYLGGLMNTRKERPRCCSSRFEGFDVVQCR